ncbi:MAG TPA: MmcQ/YjbR family DNA-binding protein [Patescibacteria group bacterium]|jgi:predicted DNA-binding protein (MmcQ/YjbR family)|nr:MmcQ/YjbR family DNA-binding protein [Patescibacteria group bacterium]
MTQDALQEYLLSFPDTWLDFPFGDDVLVYKVGPKDSPESKMFALIAKDSKPVRLSLKCDPQLAEILRETYESVQPGYHLNKRHWNTILCTGQVGDDELRDLMRHSYQLASA